MHPETDSAAVMHRKGIAGHRTAGTLSRPWRICLCPRASPSSPCFMLRALRCAGRNTGTHRAPRPGGVSATLLRTVTPPGSKGSASRG